MIVADLKPIEDIMSYLEGHKRILLVGCHGCVTVCSAGGQKEVELLADMIELARRAKGQECSITKMTLERQCDPEYVDQLEEPLTTNNYDAVLSMACSVLRQPDSSPNLRPQQPERPSSSITSSLKRRSGTTSAAHRTASFLSSRPCASRLRSRGRTESVGKSNQLVPHCLVNVSMSSRHRSVLRCRYVSRA